MLRPVTLVLVVCCTLAACGEQNASLGGAPGPSTAELVVDGQEPLVCGGSPVSVLTADGGVEEDDTPESAALREITRTGIAGMSFPKPDDWLVLSRTEDRVQFGRRVGASGIDEVVGVARQADGSWDFSGSGGCGRGISYTDGRAGIAVDGYATDGRRLDLRWSGGSCVGDPGSTTQADVQVVQERADEVRLLLVTRPSPPRAGDGLCTGVGMLGRTPITLSAPLGDRAVVDLSQLPAATVPSDAQAEATRQEDERQAQQAARWCAAGARQLGGRDLQTAYPYDVATVRRHVPAVTVPWRELEDGDEAAGCFLEHEGRRWAFVVASGVEPVVYARDQSLGGLYAKLE